MKIYFFIKKRFILIYFISCFLTMPTILFPDSKKKLYHHTEKGFRNLPGGLPMEKASFFKKFFGFYIKKVFENYNAQTIPKNHIVPYEKAVEILKSTPNNQDTLTWIGHMTTLIRLDNQYILTDPFFSNVASPLPPFGPRRTIAPGIKIKDLPPIDVILISHSHYDHLDMPSLKLLAKKNKSTVVLPLKLGVYAKEAKFNDIIELDWYEKSTVKGLEIITLPVIHWSKRKMFKKNDTLWAGFSIQSSKRKIFFSGDLEYGTHYKSLGEKYGPFDLAILSISPDKPKFIMQGHHCSPINCLKIGLEIKAKTFMPVHWGTIQLGTNAFSEPIEMFKKGSIKLKIDNKQLNIFRIGETKQLK